ncbi:MAG: hypothetical protein K2W95_14400 [Candidatus Obscuribacterales bacterium]|nr:hypothetical protein [Candidatus Obscuribacterales bacterium]
MSDSRVGQEENKRTETPFRPGITINDVHSPPWRAGDREQQSQKSDSSSIAQSPWRSKTGDTATPASLVPEVKPNDGRDPNRNGGNGQAPWRRNWNDVAPPAVNPPQVKPNDGRDPNQNGGNGQAPWRRNWGDVAPPAANPPQVKPNDGHAPNRPILSPPQGTNQGVPSWREYAENNKPRDNGPWQAPNVRGAVRPGDGSPASGGSQSPVSDTQLSNLMNSRRPKTSMAGFLYTGGITGATMNAGMYALDSRLLSVPEAERSGMMKMWEKVSPAAKALKGQAEAAKLATTTFSSANQALGIAQLELDAIAKVPNTIFQAAEAQTKLLQPVAEEVSLLTAQKSFLQSHATITNADDVLKRIGSASEVGENGVLFERGSTAATQLEAYATHLRAKGSGIAGVAVPNMGQSIAEVEAKLAGLATKAVDFGTAQQRLLFLRSGLAGNAAAVEQVLGTSAEVLAGQKLFERGSAEATELLLYASKAEAHAAATKALDIARANMGVKESALKQALERGAGEYHGSLLGTTARGLAKGLGVSATTMAAGYGLDYLIGQKFGYQPSTDGYDRFIADGVIVPGILLSNYHPRVKIGLAASVFGLARASDYCAGTMASTETSMLLRTNTCDAVGVTGFALAPLPGKIKAIGIAAPLGLGRGYNLIARAQGWDGFKDSAESLDSDLAKVRDLDSTTQTRESFDRSVEKAKQLGLSNPGVLEYRLTQLMDRANLHPVEKERQIASLSIGLARARLERGSRLTVRDYTSGAYFLEGTRADFGCTAAEQLNSALISLERVRKYAAAHPNESVKGHKLDDSYIKQLDELKGIVDSTLNSIYGEQDIDKVYGEVRKVTRTKVVQLLTFIEEGNEKLIALGENLGPADVRYAAKMSRDLALANLAYAESCVQAKNGEDARDFYNAAVNNLTKARELEATSKNNPKLARLVDSIRARVPGAVQAQWGNTLNNPFQLKPNSHGPAKR